MSQPVVAHHIACDGWSFGLLMRELGVFYEAARTGMIPALAQLPVQYADYTRSEQDPRRSLELERQRDYWRARLACPASRLRSRRTGPALPCAPCAAR